MDAETSFDAIAGEWNALYQAPRPWFPLFKKYFKTRAVVLDAGCGNANNAIAIAPLVKKVYALDVSRNMLVFARKNVCAAGLSKKISFKQASVLELPFKNGFFDVCAYFAVLHHFRRKTEREKAFFEMNRVLKKGGLAVVTVWNKHRGKQFVPFTKKTGEKVLRTHHFYTEKEIAFLAEKTGFSVRALFYESKGKRVSCEKGKNLCVVLRKL